MYTSCNAPQQAHPLQAAPVLGLRMRPDAASSSEPITTDSENDVDRVRNMLRQDEMDYRCDDYLARQHEEQMAAMYDPSESEATPIDITDRATPAPTSATRGSSPIPLLTRSEFLVDAVCREKMCEWSYRVCDHFGANRRIVAVSFSYLDRFVDANPRLDRTTFKLAAMVTLFMASKVYLTRPLTSVSNLAELSRGEFAVAHIAAMEEIILRALAWRLHPPAAQCFLSAFRAALPEGASAATPDRAEFFCELSLYDYALAPCRRSIVAAAALMNALEGTASEASAAAAEAAFLHALRISLGVELDRDAVERTRDRLWRAYGWSAQYVEDGVPTPYGHEMPTAIVDDLEKSISSPTSRKHAFVQSQSPVCVMASNE